MDRFAIARRAAQVSIDEQCAEGGKNDDGNQIMPNDAGHDATSLSIDYAL
jgi:hypothetical protein